MAPQLLSKSTLYEDVMGGCFGDRLYVVFICSFEQEYQISMTVDEKKSCEWKIFDGKGNLACISAFSSMHKYMCHGFMEKFILIPWNDRMKVMRNDLSVCCHQQKDSVLFPFNTNAKQRNREWMNERSARTCNRCSSCALVMVLYAVACVVYANVQTDF